MGKAGLGARTVAGLLASLGLATTPACEAEPERDAGHDASVGTENPAAHVGHFDVGGFDVRAITNPPPDAGPDVPDVPMAGEMDVFDDEDAGLEEDGGASG